MCSGSLEFLSLLKLLAGCGVAEGRIGRELAAAEVHHAGALVKAELYWLEERADVRTVAEGL